MSYPRAIPTTWLLAFTLAVGSCQLANAGTFYIEGGVGAAFFHPTVDDGTWRQDGVQTPNFRLMDQAWTIGAGHRWDAWSIQGHRFDWGSSQVKSLFASDEAYYGGKCPGQDCPTAHYKVVDRMWGFDLTMTRHFHIQGTKWEPYLKGGAAIAFHELKWTEPNSSTFGKTRVHGAIPMLVIGVGIAYELFYLDTSFYTGTTSMNSGCIGGGEYECGYPLSKQVVVTTVGLRIPLKF